MATTATAADGRIVRSARTPGGFYFIQYSDGTVSLLSPTTDSVSATLRFPPADAAALVAFLAPERVALVDVEPAALRQAAGEALAARDGEE